MCIATLAILITAFSNSTRKLKNLSVIMKTWYRLPYFQLSNGNRYAPILDALSRCTNIDISRIFYQKIQLAVNENLFLVPGVIKSENSRWPTSVFQLKSVNVVRLGNNKSECFSTANQVTFVLIYFILSKKLTQLMNSSKNLHGRLLNFDLYL